MCKTRLPRGPDFKNGSTLNGVATANFFDPSSAKRRRYVQFGSSSGHALPSTMRFTKSPMYTKKRFLVSIGRPPDSRIFYGNHRVNGQVVYGDGAHFTDTVEDTASRMLRCKSFFFSPNLDTPTVLSQLHTNFRCSFQRAPRVNIRPKPKIGFDQNGTRTRGLCGFIESSIFPNQALVTGGGY